MNRRKVARKGAGVTKTVRVNYTGVGWVSKTGSSQAG